MPEPKISNRALVTLSLTLSTALGLIVAETACRFGRPFYNPETLRSESMEYESGIFARATLPRVEKPKFQINKQGFRGPEVQVPKPAGVTRIAILGGSGAFDIYAQPGKDWPRLVETKLRAQGFSNVEVMNTATPGDASWEMLNRLYAEVWLYRPDVVLLYSTWNDVKYFGWLSPERSLLRSYKAREGFAASELSGNPFLHYTSGLDRVLCKSQFYVKLRTQYWRWRLGIDPMKDVEGALEDKRNSEPKDSYGPWGPEQYELDMRLLVEGVRQIKATPVLLTQAMLVRESNTPEQKAKIFYKYAGLQHSALVRALSETNAILAKVASATKSPFIDVDGELGGRGEYFTDHAHTTAQGSEAVAETVATQLGKILTKPPARSLTEAK